MQGPSTLICEGNICFSRIGCKQSLEKGKLIFVRRADSKWFLNVHYLQKRENEIELSPATMKTLPPDFDTVCRNGDFQVPFNDGVTLVCKNGRSVGNVVGGLAEIGRLLLAIKDGVTRRPDFGNEIHDMSLGGQWLGLGSVAGDVTPQHRPPRNAGVNSAPPPGRQATPDGGNWRSFEGGRCGRNNFSHRSFGPRYYASSGSNGYCGGGDGQQMHPKKRNGSYNQFQNNRWQQGNEWKEGGWGHNSGGSPFGNDGYQNRGSGRSRMRERGRRPPGRFQGRSGHGGGAASSHREQFFPQARRSPNYSQTAAQPLKDRGSAENSLDRSSSDRKCDELYKGDGNHSSSGSSGSMLEISNCSNHDLSDENVHPETDGCAPSPRRQPSSTSPSESTPSSDGPNGLSRSRFYGKSTPKQLYPLPSPISTSANKSGFQPKRQTLLPMPSPAKKIKVNPDDELDKENRVSLSQTYTRSRPTKLSGFKNLGNTCYMNAILQSLYCLDYFSRDLLNIYEMIKHILPKKSLYRSICELLLEKDTPNSQHANDFYEGLLSNFKSSVEQSFRSFVGHHMQDAHEFVTQMLDHLKEEVDGIANTLADTESRPVKRLDNPVRRNFEFETVEKYVCTKCSNVVSKKQVAYDLGVFVPKARKPGVLRSLQLVLDASFKTEKREFRCEKCEHNESTVDVRLSKLPRILSVHLKRYMVNGTHIQKNATPLIVPRYLTLKDHTCEEVDLSGSFNTSNTSDSSGPSDLTGPSVSSSSSCGGGPDNSGFLTSHLMNEEITDFGVNFNAAVHMIPVSSSDSEDNTTIRLISKEPVFGLCGGQGPISSDATETCEASSEHVKSAEDAEVDGLSQVAIDRNAISDEDIDFWAKYEPGNVKEDVSKEDDEDEDLRKAKLLSLQDLAQNVEALADPEVEEEEEGEEDTDEMDKLEECLLVKENFETGDLPNSYHLVSVVLHMGNIEKGHYTCNSFDFKKSIYRKYDDSDVTEINEGDFFTDAKTHGYILMYIHKVVLTWNKLGTGAVELLCRGEDASELNG